MCRGGVLTLMQEKPFAKYVLCPYDSETSWLKNLVGTKMLRIFNFFGRRLSCSLVCGEKGRYAQKGGVAKVHSGLGGAPLLFPTVGRASYFIWLLFVDSVHSSLYLFC